MDPSTLITLVLQLLDLISSASNKRWARSSKTILAELQLFRTQLDEHLLYVKDILKVADALGFTLKSLEMLLDELQKFVSSADGLFNKKGCKKQHIQELRELVMSTFQHRMTCALMQMAMKNYEIQSKAYEQLKAVIEMMVKKQGKQGMTSKRHDVHIAIFEEKACRNLKLMELLSFVRNIDAGMTEGAGEDVMEGELVYNEEVEKSGRWMKEGAREDVLEEVYNEELEGAGKDPLEEKKNKKRRETILKDTEKLALRPTELKEWGAGKDVPEEEEEEKQNKKMKEAVLIRESDGNDEQQEEEKNKGRNEELWRKEMEKQGHRATELKDDEQLDNPNRNMELSIEEGKGELLVSKYEVSQFILTYKWRDESMRIVIGERPMEVSKKLGYFYFGVKLLEMAELAEGRETSFAYVGVGLARMDKFRTSKVAGKYSKSCGYDGQSGEVLCESRVHRSRMGFLAKGDTLGIGLLQHHGQHTIFFVKNGVLRLRIQDHTLRATSRHGGLYPIISLASAHVQLHVDFCGPSQISELVAQMRAALPPK